VFIVFILYCFYLFLFILSVFVTNKVVYIMKMFLSVRVEALSGR